MQCLFMSCISFTLSNEIEWLDSYEREVLGQMLPGLHGVTGNMDNLLVKVIHPYNNPNHSIGSMVKRGCTTINNIIIVDNNGLFIYVDLMYLRSFHDITCLRDYELDTN